MRQYYSRLFLELKRLAEYRQPWEFQWCNFGIGCHQWFVSQPSIRSPYQGPC